MQVPLYPLHKADVMLRASKYKQQAVKAPMLGQGKLYI